MFDAIAACVLSSAIYGKDRRSAATMRGTRPGHGDGDVAIARTHLTAASPASILRRGCWGRPRKNRRSRPYGADKARTGRCGKLDFPDRTFHGVTIAFVVPQRPRPLLRSAEDAAGVLAPTGRIAILTLQTERRRARALARFHVHARSQVPMLSGARVSLPATVHRRLPAGGQFAEQMRGCGVCGCSQ